MTSHRDEPPAGPAEPIVLDISDAPILQRGCPSRDDRDGQLSWFAAVLRLWLYRTRDEGWAMPGPDELRRFGEWLAGPDGPQSWSWPQRAAATPSAPAGTPAPPGLDVDATDGRWAPGDLDRCQHGRHSLDNCDGCPGGKSAGNLYLLNMGVASRGVSIDEADGVQTVRIGTTYDRRPILMRPDRRPRW